MNVFLPLLAACLLALAGCRESGDVLERLRATEDPGHPQLCSAARFDAMTRLDPARLRDLLPQLSLEGEDRFLYRHLLDEAVRRDGPGTAHWLTDHPDTVAAFPGHYRQALGALTRKAPAAALRLVENAPRDHKAVVWEAFGSLDPAAAFTAWDARRGDQAASATNHQFAWISKTAFASDPHAAAAWLATQPDAADLLPKVFHSITHTWPRKDPVGAVRWVQEDPKPAGFDRMEALRGIRKAIGLYARDQAAEAAAAFPLHSSERWELVRESAPRIARDRSPEFAREWVDALPTETDRRAGRLGLHTSASRALGVDVATPRPGDPVFDYVARRVDALGLPATRDWAQSLKYPGERQPVLYALGTRWAEEDPDGAIRGATGLEDEADRAAFQAGFRSGTGGSR